MAQVGPRFADDVVADGALAPAPFLHVAGDLGLRGVAGVSAVPISATIGVLLGLASGYFEAVSVGSACATPEGKTPAPASPPLRGCALTRTCRSCAD